MYPWPRGEAQVCKTCYVRSNRTGYSIFMSHKHCVFCGESSDSGENICYSHLNPLPVDTVGNKPHGFPMSCKERAGIAAERARTASPNEIEFFEA